MHLSTKSADASSNQARPTALRIAPLSSDPCDWMEQALEDFRRQVEGDDGQDPPR